MDTIVTVKLTNCLFRPEVIIGSLSPIVPGVVYGWPLLEIGIISFASGLLILALSAFDVFGIDAAIEEAREDSVEQSADEQAALEGFFDE